VIQRVIYHVGLPISTKKKIIFHVNE
jgi:hypothetical protein